MEAQDSLIRRTRSSYRAGTIRSRTIGALQVMAIAVVASACATATTPGSASPSPSGSAASQAPSVAPSASDDTGAITDDEIVSLTGGVGTRSPTDDPAATVSAATAEATVRAQYPGERSTIGVVLIGMGLPSGTRTGWFVALTPAVGEACDLHAGLLPRAVEGGVVDDQTGEMFWVFKCGP